MTRTTSDWFFLSNHGSVLLSIAGDPAMQFGEIAQLVGVTESAVGQIVEELLADGYLVDAGSGEQARYEINRKAHLRHPLFARVEIGPLIDALREHQAEHR
jgi:DNA-binding Lrp family transcriptional regulator